MPFYGNSGFPTPDFDDDNCRSDTAAEFPAPDNTPTYSKPAMPAYFWYFGFQR